MRDQREIDASHLKTLAICHFVMAGLGLLGVGFLALHYLMFSVVMVPAFEAIDKQASRDLTASSATSSMNEVSPPAPPIQDALPIPPEDSPLDDLLPPTPDLVPPIPPQPELPIEMEAFFGLFKWFYLLAGLLMVGHLVLNLFTGLGLLKYRLRPLSFVTAGINCLSFPLGTVLGVFTFIVLGRETVAESYRWNNS